MISSKTAQILKYCGLFLLVLFFNSFDLAITVTLSLYLAINSKTYIKLFGFSLVLFILDIIFRNFDISFRFISDLSLDSYILLLTAFFIYAKSQRRITDFFRQAGASGRKIFSSNNLVLLVVSIVLALLLLPILGPPAAVIVGYLSFSYFSKRFEGKYAYTAGLFFLSFSPFFIIFKRDDIAENFAIISFYFLIIGTVQETVRLVRERKPFAFSLPKINFGAKILHFMHSFRLPQFTRKTESQSKGATFDNPVTNDSKNFISDEISSNRLQPIMKFIIIVCITGLLSFTVISTIINSKAKNTTSTIAEKLTITPIIPSPTIDIGVELMVENGTEISGLAASTAAKLKFPYRF